jgi:hypothetical protein
MHVKRTRDHTADRRETRGFAKPVDRFDDRVTIRRQRVSGRGGLSTAPLPPLALTIARANSCPDVN